MKYTNTEFDPPVKVVLKGLGASFDATDTIRFSPAGSGTRIEYSARLNFSGLNARFERLLEPFLKFYGKKSG